MTPQTLIDEWRPHRDALRPPECDYRTGCWVFDPFGAVLHSTVRARCRLCGGCIERKGWNKRGNRLNNGKRHA